MNIICKKKKIKEKAILIILYLYAIRMSMNNNFINLTCLYKFYITIHVACGNNLLFSHNFIILLSNN